MAVYNVNHEARAALAWPVLVRQASHKKIITYDDLGQAIDVYRRALSKPLGHIQKYCLEAPIPPLTILVTNVRGRPGSGFTAWDVNDFDEGVQQVFSFDWSTVRNPFTYALKTGHTQKSLGRTVFNAPERSEEVYALVRVRGVAQRVFRETLMLAYEGACAFCGFSFPEALDSAHIIPWPKCTWSQRLDPRNGLLLCATHHRLFDAGWLTISRDLLIQHEEADASDGPYSAADVALTRQLHGQYVREPVRLDLRPSPAFIVRGNKLRGH